MNYFVNVEDLMNLERQGKWEAARELLSERWKEERQNSKYLIRLLGECWHVLSLWDCCINTENLSFQAFQNTLIECTEFGLQNFKNDPYFLCMAGYMISTLPHLFYHNDTGNSYAEWEQKGIVMLFEASELAPHDEVAKVLYLGYTSKFQQYNDAKKSLSLKLSSLFPEETELETYFKSILSI